MHFTQEQLDKFTNGFGSRLPDFTPDMSKEDIAKILEKMCNKIKALEAHIAKSEDDSFDDDVCLTRTASSHTPTHVEMCVGKRSQDERQTFLHDFMTSESAPVEYFNGSDAMPSL